MTSEEFLTALYRGLFGRSPDPAGFEHHRAALDAGVPPVEIVRRFVGSHEFRLGIERHVDRYPLDRAPAMPIESDVDAEGIQVLWDHVARVWARYGDRDPYWSVLTDERWRQRHMERDEALDEFYATGRIDIDRLQAWLRRNDLISPSDGVCVEYGCGVGRVTHWLARCFRRVVAVDVSQPHLDAARQRLERDGIANVDYVRVTGRQDLNAMAGFDFFFSIIVLQHNPPPIIRDVLQTAFAGARPGAMFFFQLPTYATDYRFSLDDYRRYIAEGQDMEMHFLRQSEVFRLAAAHEVVPVEVQPDYMIGHPSTWISNTFLLRKTSPGHGRETG